MILVRAGRWSPGGSPQSLRVWVRPPEKHLVADTPRASPPIGPSAPCALDVRASGRMRSGFVRLCVSGSRFVSSGHVAPLGWEHIALTGDYDWNTSRPADGLRPLRAVPEAFSLRAA